MKTPSQRGIIGAWAYEARDERGLSVEQVAEALSARGQAVTAATIRGIESGNKKPGARLLRLLGDVLESAPPGTETKKEPGEVDLPGLVVALTNALQAQAQALTDIRLELGHAARDAAEERAATGDVLARLEAELIVLRERLGSATGSVAPHSGRDN